MICGCGNSVIGSSSNFVNNIIAGDNITLTPNGNLNKNSVTINSANVNDTLQEGEGISLQPSGGNLIVNALGNKQDFCYMFKTQKNSESPTPDAVKEFGNDKIILLDVYETRYNNTSTASFYSFTNGILSFQQTGAYHIQGRVSFTSQIPTSFLKMYIAKSAKGELLFEPNDEYCHMVSSHQTDTEDHTFIIDGIIQITNPWESVAMLLEKTTVGLSESVTIQSIAMYVTFIEPSIITLPNSYPTEKYRPPNTMFNFVKGYQSAIAYNTIKINNTTETASWTPDIIGVYATDVNALGSKMINVDPLHRLVSNYQLLNPNENYTVSVRCFFPTVLSNEVNVLIGNNTVSLGFSHTAGGLSYMYLKHGASAHLSIPSIPALPAWNTYTWVFNSTLNTCEFVINGTFFSNANAVPNFVLDGNFEGIGHKNDGALGDEFVFGSISHIEIWNNYAMPPNLLGEHFFEQSRLI